MTQLTHSTNLPATAELNITSISAFTEHFINQMKSGKVLTDKGVVYKDSSIRQYKMFYDYLQVFEKLHEKKFEFTEINYKFGKAFQVYLTDQDLTLNSISNILKKFKAIMSMAFREGLAFWNGSGLKTPTEITTEVTLSIDEIKKLRSTQLNQSDSQILEIFVIQCFTGLRYDVLCKFLKSPFNYIQENSGKSYIDIVSDKTGEPSVIPLHVNVQKIIAAREGKFKIYSEQHINRAIKLIAEKAELDKEIVNRRTESGKTLETFVPKWQKIKSHTARRTFATILSKTDIPNNQIMAMTGHTTEKQLKLYMRSGKLSLIQPALTHDFFNTEI